MPHQCVHCNKIYPDCSNELLQGCTDCGGKFFFFIKKDAVQESQKIVEDLTQKEKTQIEKDVFEIVGDKLEEQVPIFLDIESIRILRPGQYELDLVSLFKGKPLIYRLEDGKYVIDLISTFQSRQKE